MMVQFNSLKNLVTQKQLKSSRSQKLVLKQLVDATVKGIVTARLKNTIHIQDETAAIAVRPTSLDVQLGDEIIVKWFITRI